MVKIFAFLEDLVELGPNISNILQQRVFEKSNYLTFKIFKESLMPGKYI